MFRFTAFLVLPVVLVSLVNPVEGVEIKIVSPSPWADVEAAYGTPPQLESSRSQQVFTAQDFMDLPAGNRTLTGIVWRPDGDYGGNGEWTATEFRVRMSTTDKQVGGLSYTYADNWGDDLTTVYEGAVAASQTHSGPVGGPKDFDAPTPLQTPFVYDPNEGNLLVDVEIRNLQYTGTISFDIIHDTNQSYTQYIWGGADDPSAYASVGGLVYQFTFEPVPEPSTWLLAASGLGGLVLYCFRTKRKRARSELAG